MIKLPKLIFNLTWINKIAENITNSYWAIFIFLFVTGFAYWLTQINFLDLYLSSTGFSPLAVIYSTFDPIVSKIDFPQGVHNLKKSLPVNVYFWFHAYTNFNLIHVMKAYMLFEIYLLLFAHYYFFTTVIKKNIPALSFIFTLIVSLSITQHMDLARFALPYIWGLYYTIAASLSIIGITMVLKNKPWFAIASFSLAVMTHPIISFFGIATSSLIIVSRGFDNLKKYIIPSIIFIIINLIWFFSIYKNSDIFSGNIPSDHWISLTKIFNYHWYPFSIGVFTTLSQSHFLPMLSVMLLYMFCRRRIKNNNFILSKEIDIFVILLSIITLAGLIISYYEVSPFLVKLSLHRASNLLIVIALIPILYVLWLEINSGRIIKKSLAMLIFLSPITGSVGFPLVLSLLYTFMILIELFKKKKLIDNYILIFIFCLTLSIFFYYLLKGYHHKLLPGKNILWIISLIFVVFSLFKFPQAKIFLIIIYISFLLPYANWKKNLGFGSKINISNYELQLWAKNNTKKDELFMLYPTYYYGGWRDISQRASFGTLREWLHNTWIYESNFKAYEEGVRRFSLLGLELEKYILLEPRDAKQKIMIDSAQAYYNANNEWFKKIKKEENIDYFIFEKQFMKNNKYELHCPYENTHFAICK